MISVGFQCHIVFRVSGFYLIVSDVPICTQCEIVTVLFNFYLPLLVPDIFYLFQCLHEGMEGRKCLHLFCPDCISFSLANAEG